MNGFRKFPFTIGIGVALILFAGKASADSIVPVNRSDFISNITSWGPSAPFFYPFRVDGGPYRQFGPNSHDSPFPAATSGGYFVGQSLSSTGTTCIFQAAVGCVMGTPTGPLAVDPNAPWAFGPNDGSPIPYSESESGNGPYYSGSVAIWLAQPQAAILLANFLHMEGIAITAYEADGSLLGTLIDSSSNLQEFFIGTADGQPEISGFTVDFLNVDPSFGAAAINLDQRYTPSAASTVPEPDTVVFVSTGVLACVISLRHRLKKI